MSNVLIATLGESPIVITAMFDKLAEQEGIKIDRVVIVYPQGRYTELTLKSSLAAFGKCNMLPVYMAEYTRITGSSLLFISINDTNLRSGHCFTSSLGKI